MALKPRSLGSKTSIHSLALELKTSLLALMRFFFSMSMKPLTKEGWFISVVVVHAISSFVAGSPSRTATKDQIPISCPPGLMAISRVYEKEPRSLLICLWQPVYYDWSTSKYSKLRITCSEMDRGKKIRVRRIQCGRAKIARFWIDLAIEKIYSLHWSREIKLLHRLGNGISSLYSMCEPSASTTALNMMAKSIAELLHILLGHVVLFLHDLLLQLTDTAVRSCRDLFLLVYQDPVSQ